jgi:hypothetical protein
MWSKKWVVANSASYWTVNPYRCLGIYSGLLAFWAESADTEKCTQVVKKRKASKLINVFKPINTKRVLQLIFKVFLIK